MIKLSLLANPEDTEGKKAHEIHRELGKEGGHGLKQVALGVNSFVRRKMEFEQKQRHGHGKDTVAERGQAFSALTGDASVAGPRPKTFSSAPGPGYRDRNNDEIGSGCKRRERAGAPWSQSIGWCRGLVL